MFGVRVHVSKLCIDGIVDSYGMIVMYLYHVLISCVDSLGMLEVVISDSRVVISRLEDIGLVPAVIGYGIGISGVVLRSTGLCMDNRVICT